MIPTPNNIYSVVEKLQNFGHTAVVVGGAVRDSLLGKPANDWDVATSATPDQVSAAFPNAIPVGISHGTVLIPVEGSGIEVTTFRGEGEYLDGRRPSSVVFHQDLTADLERRDFTVNAIAWDPIRKLLIDPLGGREDLEARVLRAVGNPKERFNEDALRTLRAVRFCATLEFELEGSTKRAISDSLLGFSRVSRERVNVEIEKMLKARTPSRGVVPMNETGLWDCVFPNVPFRSETHVLDALPRDSTARLAYLLLHAENLELCLQKQSLEVSQKVRAFVGQTGKQLAKAELAFEIRRLASQLHPILSRSDLGVLAEVHGASRQTIEEALEGAPLHSNELNVRGKDLLEAGFSPGPKIGQLLSQLIHEVWSNKLQNVREELLQRVSELR